MSAPKRRNFKVEVFKHRVEVDPKYAKKTWKVIEHAIHEIYNENSSGLSFEELYRLPGLRLQDISFVAESWGPNKTMPSSISAAVSGMLTTWFFTNMGEKLFSELVTTMTWHLKEMSRTIEAAQGGFFFLEELNRK